MSTTTDVLRFTSSEGHSDLCRPCIAVMAMEGRLTGDPREDDWTWATMKSIRPADAGTECVACLARRDGKAWREGSLPVLPARLRAKLIAA